MLPMNLDLSFFASLLQTDIKDLDFAIVKRKYNDGTSRMFPCLTVCGIKNYVFSLKEGEFVSLEKRCDSTLTLMAANVVKTEQGIVLRTKQGHSIPYTKKEFRRFYSFRVVNPALYQ